MLYSSFTSLLVNIASVLIVFEHVLYIVTQAKIIELTQIEDVYLYKKIGSHWIIT